MDLQQEEIAESCLASSYADTLNFPTVLAKLDDAGFEGYLVDYRRSMTTYYLPTGESVEFMNLKTPGAVAPSFDAQIVAENVRKSQAQAQTYREFSENVKNAGCAGYLVTLLGKRVVYFGRTGETHIELIPT
jgi:uncharacterized protein YbcV (DUF1398 family)